MSENRLLRTACEHLKETMTELDSQAKLLDRTSQIVPELIEKKMLLSMANGIRISIKELQKNLDAMNFNLGDSI